MAGPLEKCNLERVNDQLLRWAVWNPQAIPPASVWMKGHVLLQACPVQARDTSAQGMGHGKTWGVSH